MKREYFKQKYMNKNKEVDMKKIVTRGTDGNKGITLIALVITIIVLLILAGVTIATLTGENGILTRASEARTTTVVADEKEAINMAWQAVTIGKRANGDNTNIEASALENQLHTDGRTTAEVIGTGTLTVTYSDTGHSYAISQEGNIVSEDLEETPQIADTNPGEFNGTGTEDDPYLIESIEDLVALSTNTNSGESYTGKYFQITQTLDFNSTKSYVNAEEKYVYSSESGGYVKDANGEAIKTLCTSGEGFIPIGICTENYGFEGIFNGNDCSIKNLYINRETAPENMEDYIGLFGYITDSTIENLTLTGQITAKNMQYIGRFVGSGDNWDDGVIKNCHNKVNINCLQVSGYIGGIAGNLYGSIENCTNEGNITFEESAGVSAGGIAGHCLGGSGIDGIIRNCTNNGDIMFQRPYEDMSDFAETYIAGICGYNNGAMIQECINNGGIDTEFSKNLYLGGISGYNDSWSSTSDKGIATIKDSTNNGKVIGISTEKNVYIGGISGYSEELSIVENSTNNGTIEGQAPKGTPYQNDSVGYVE